MPLSPLQIIGPSYKVSTLPISAQESINLFLETEDREGSRNNISLKGTPGLRLLTTLGGGPNRGFALLDNVLYAVSGTKLYKVDKNLNATLIGTIPGVNPVRSTSNAYQIIFVNGEDGYVLESGSLTKITDDAYIGGSKTVDYIDGFAVQDASGGRFYWNDVQAISASFADYLGTDFAIAASDPDDVVGVIVDHLEIFVFGQRRTEVWTLTASGPDQTFQRSANAVIERGCGGAYTLVRLDNTVFFLGEDGIIYRMNGYQPVRISDIGIEEDIANLDWSKAQAFGYTDEGHKFYQISFEGGKTWVYDCKTNMWHRRKSYELDRCRVQNYIYAYGKHIVGDFENGCIYEMTREVFEENGQPLIAERVTGFLHNNQQPIFMPYMEVLVDTGTAAEYNFDPKIELQTSRDYGRTWSEWRNRSLGERGEYAKRCSWHGMGRFTNALVRLRIAGNIKRDIVAANGQIEGGESRGG